MKTHRLQTRLWLPQPRDRIFQFFADPFNLERLTPDWLRFETLTKQTTEIREGVLLDYRLRIRGLPIRWQSRIADWNPPHRFVDRQTKGPYRLWVHEHTFVEDKDGTLVGDDVQYAVPGGRLVQKFLVAPDLDRIFKYRHQVLQTLFNPGNKAARGVDADPF
ncbi:MAG: CDP-paratose 2-epimerase [Deltaproteobacteria bacterium]|nr:CDP-paratose 2-epimerase [Deltaproteobacteria bacterium]